MPRHFCEHLHGEQSREHGLGLEGSYRTVLGYFVGSVGYQRKGVPLKIKDTAPY
jgi:hypothetical protein